MKLQKIIWLLLILIVRSVSAQDIDNTGWFNADGSATAIPASASDVTSAYLPSGNYTPSFISSTGVPDAITPEIQALARGLANDPKRIFDFVHDHIRHVLYFGSKKGAQLTLLEKSGNDFDQCALLVALLRAAGFAPAYQFGLLIMPFDSSDHVDIHHWLGVDFPNTNYGVTTTNISHLMQVRGYPFFYTVDDNNSFAFHRVWVALQVGGTVYFLDPAFKTSEPISGIDLHSAMQIDTNALLAAAGGTFTNDSIRNISLSGLNATLTGYTTNLLAFLQTNSPNAAVEEIIGGQKIVSSATNSLSGEMPFINNVYGGIPVQTWPSIPTTYMSTLTVSTPFASQKWYVPDLQGHRLSISCTTNAHIQLWEENTNVFDDSGSSVLYNPVPITFAVHHPHGIWDFTNNTLIDEGIHDQSLTITFAISNATYAIVYAFEAGPDELRERQDILDSYRAQGLSDTSREVVSETLNIMGLSWLLQTELAERMICSPTNMNMLSQHHHRIGRMAQEKNKGYYVDVYEQWSGIVSARGGYGAAEPARERAAFDVSMYLSSAFEHGIIQQFQTNNLIAASTVNMLLLSSTNTTQKVFLASPTNWTTGSNIRSQLTHYTANDLSLLDAFITNGASVLLPLNGSNHINGASGWAGWGAAERREIINNSSWQSTMLIFGRYNGGIVSDSNAIPNPATVLQIAAAQPNKFTVSPATMQNAVGGDPINMADGSLLVGATDLSLGNAAPRGLQLARYYSPARRNFNSDSMANGWGHNYSINISDVSAPLAGLGQTTPAQMASMLVATRVMSELYQTNGTAKFWDVTALVAKWGVDQIIGNGASVKLGNDTIQFVKQPDGTFTPPANSTLTLTKSAGAYTLTERNGNAFKFNSGNRLTNIVDEYNQSLAIAYDSSNRVQVVTDWKSNSLTFAYSGGRLSSITDDAGRSVSYGYSTTYNSLGDLVSVTDPEHQTSTFIYDTNHQMIAMLDALNRSVFTNIYDGFGRVIEQDSQGDTNRAWRFFWSGPVNVEQDPAGSRRSFFFDDKYRPIALQDALGNLSQVSYDGQDHVLSSISPLNETNRYEFDGQHNLLRAIDPLNRTNQFFYDTQNRLIKTIDPRGNVNGFGYNTKDQLTSFTNGAGDFITLTYSTADGTLTNLTDSAGSTGLGYDSFGQLSAITYPNSLGREGFLNNSLGNVLSYTNARGFVTSFQYNLRRQPTNSIGPTNITARVSYDAVGNVQSVTDSRGFSASFAWSPTRKLVSSLSPSTPQGSPFTTNIYDARDWIISSINPLQKAVLLTNNVNGQTIAVADPLLRTSRFGYDADGQMVAATNGASEVVQQKFDSLGQIVQTVTPRLATIGYGYDTVGNETLLTNRNGKVWQFQFDAANRLTNVISPFPRTFSQVWNNRGLVSSTREPSAQTQNFTYDALGRLTNRSDTVGATTFRYDPNNNLTNVIENGKTNSWTFDAYDRVASYKDANGNLIQYRYDDNGNLTNLIYPGGKTVVYSYDSLNRLTNVTDWALRKTTFSYDLADQLTGITRPNGTVRTINYDADGEATNIIEKAASNFPIAFFAMNYDGAARVSWEFNAPLPHSNSLPARSMTYDDDNRLITINSQSVSSDSDGNMTNGPLPDGTFASYGYDARNRLLNAGGVTNIYDALNGRIAQSYGTNSISYVVNPNGVLPQVLMRVKNGVTNYYIYGLGLLYQVIETATATNTLTYHFDSRGSTVALSGDDGMPTDRFEYSAYASTTYRAGTNDTPFLFNGRDGVMTDPNGLLYMRARYYNPYISRFLNPDPSGFSGGLNSFAYADGDPMDYVDPFGMNASASGYSRYSWVITPKSVTGWAYDQLNDLSHSIIGMSEEAAAAPFDIGGDSFNSIQLSQIGQYLRERAQDMHSQQGQAARAGWYDPHNPVTITADVGVIFVNPEEALVAVKEITTPIGELRAAGLNDAHHVIQDAAVRDLPGYNTQLAPGVQLKGPSTAVGTPHYLATQAQRVAGGGTYAAEREIAANSLRAAGYSEAQIQQALNETDNFFKSLGVNSSTPTRIPGNRKP